MTETVTIRRELLERHLNSNCPERLCLWEFRKTSEELRAALAAPVQAEQCPICDSKNVMHLMHCNDCEADYAGAEQINRNAQIARAAQMQGEAEPVAAQVRFRRPEKGMPDWSVWQQTTIKPKQPAWSIDSAGYEVEYRLLYTTPPQPADVEELVSDLKFLADYVWRERCGLSLPNYQALGRFPLDVAEAALAKLDPQPNSKPKETP